MQVKLAISRLVLGVVLLCHVEAGIIAISAYDNDSYQLRNSSTKSPGTSRTMSGDAGFRRIFDGLPVSYGNSTSQNSFKIPKYIVYPSNNQAVYAPQPLKEAVASDRFAPGEAYGGTVYKILKSKHEKRKGYQYQKPNAASLDDSKATLSQAPPAAPQAPPVPITPPQLAPLIAGPTPLPSKSSAKPSDPTANFRVPQSQDASSEIQYIPPSDPNVFAPNIHSHYPPPPANGDTLFDGITSYLPPAAGPVKDDTSADSKPPNLPPKITGPTPSPSPSDPNLFAPNIHSHYPPPPANGETRFNGVTSYLPPAAGPVSDDSPANSHMPDSPPSNQYIPPDALFQFPPNIHSHYHPPPVANNFHTSGLTSYLPPPAGPTDTYLPPSSGMSADSMAPGPQSSQDSTDDTIGTIPVGPESSYPYLPPSGPESPAPPAPKPQMMMAMPPPQNMMMDMPPPKNMMMSMPPGPSMSGSPMTVPFDFHGYQNYYPHDHYPEYIFDHDHDHYHDHHHDEPPPTTTPAPPPPPPPQPAKVTNYSYYKISRALWYVPLYFTIWFLFYILFCILRSISRHKVQYPNNWTGRYLGVARSLDYMQFLTNEQAMQKTDMMTQFVMKQIEDFKEKYMG